MNHTFGDNSYYHQQNCISSLFSWRCTFSNVSDIILKQENETKVKTINKQVNRLKDVEQFFDFTSRWQQLIYQSPVSFMALLQWVQSVTFDLRSLQFTEPTDWLMTNCWLIGELFKRDDSADVEGQRMLWLATVLRVNDGVDAWLDVGHLLQHLVYSGFVKLQTHELRVLGKQNQVIRSTPQTATRGSVSPVQSDPAPAPSAPPARCALPPRGWLQFAGPLSRPRPWGPTPSGSEPTDCPSLAPAGSSRSERGRQPVRASHPHHLASGSERWGTPPAGRGPCPPMLWTDTHQVTTHVLLFSIFDVFHSSDSERKSVHLVTELSTTLELCVIQVQSCWGTHFVTIRLKNMKLLVLSL